MMVSVPLAAPVVPPLTGASRTRTPKGVSAAATSCMVSAVAVVISMSTLPEEKPSRRPPAPKTVSLSSASAGRMVMTVSAARATSAGDASTVAPIAARESAGSRRLWNVVKVSNPAFTTRSAMGAPMAPKPMNPIFIE